MLTHSRESEKRQIFLDSSIKARKFVAYKQRENKMIENPFFADHYSTPHETVPFDKIKLEHFEEAIMEGIRREDEEIDKLINDPAEPTFDNTLNRIDRSKGDHYYDLPKHGNDISLNKKLFERVKYVHDHHRELTPEEQMLLDDSYDGFVRSGALLDEEGKQRLRKLTEEASLLTLKFSQNLLKEDKAFKLNITDKAQLDGLPETAIEAAEKTAKEEGKEGWLFTLDAPSYSPFMTYSTQRELRRQMYMEHMTEGTKPNSENNLEICKRLVNLRRELAQLLGYDTYADYVLKHRMATDTKTVYKLLNQLLEAYMPAARNDLKAIEQKAKEMEGDDFELMPWDFSFYSHKLQLEKYNLDAEMLRPYLELKNVIKGVFSLAERLYGITFKENKEIPVYHPDVKAYEVYDRDGKYLAVFYADFFPRKGKQDGAWMTEFQGQWIDERGVNNRPHVSVVMNFTKPTDTKPSLLTLGEVETFLHEFGHSLHGMFANTRFEDLSGTNVWWDFVELPSQFMENYAVERDFLRTFAFHYKTGEPMPDELIDRIIRSKNYNAGYSCIRQVSFSLLDMAYYTLKDEFKDDILSFERNAWAKARLMPEQPGTCMTTQFSHIMAGGYAAGYYSYKWAEVLECDAFSVFKKEGIFNPKTAQRFRDEVLSRGGTEHPMTLYKRFRGEAPTIDAMLERDGLKKPQTK